MYNKSFNDGKNNYVFDICERGKPGIYIEVAGNKIPKSVKEARLGGCGTSVYVKDDYYFTSNTNGELLHRTFKYYTELPQFKLRNEENVFSIENSGMSFNEGYEVLEKALGRGELNFRLREGRYDELYPFTLDNNYFDLEKEECKKSSFGSLTLNLNKDDFILLEHELENIDCFKEITECIFKEKEIIDNRFIRFFFKFDKKNLELFEKMVEENYENDDNANKNKVNEILDLLKISDFRWDYWIK